MNNKKLTSLDEMLDKYYGVRGTSTRDAYEEGFENFKIGVMIHEARIKQGMTQEQLADKIGTSKSYISRVENDTKDVRVSTLRKIIEGLGGHLNLSISL